MELGAQAASISKGQLWTGRVLSGIAVLFMLFDTVIHAMRGPQVVQGFAQLGFPLSIAIPLSTIEFIGIVLYVIPRTSALGRDSPHGISRRSSRRAGENWCSTPGLCAGSCIRRAPFVGRTLPARRAGAGCRPHKADVVD
jgi:hypothetical protein